MEWNRQYRPGDTVAAPRMASPVEGESVSPECLVQHEAYAKLFVSTLGDAPPQECSRCGRFVTVVGWVEDERSTERTGVVQNLHTSLPTFLPVGAIKDFIDLLDTLQGSNPDLLLTDEDQHIKSP